MNTSILVATLLLLVIFGFFVYRALRARKTLFTEAELKDIRARFFDLEKRVYWDPRHTILEGDKLLDLLLSRKGYRGTLGEKLKKVNRRLQNIQDLWDAHKVRNRIAHELGMRLEPREAKRHLASYRKAYRLCGVIVDS